MVEEKLMTAGTALSSCGIAYVFRYIRANVEGGVEMGFYQKDAQDIVDKHNGDMFARELIYAVINEIGRFNG